MYIVEVKIIQVNLCKYNEVMIPHSSRNKRLSIQPLLSAKYDLQLGGVSGLMVFVVGNGHAEFKPLTRLFAFYIALIPLGTVRIQLFFFQLGVSCWAALHPCYGNQSRRRKTLNSNLLNCAKNWPCVTSSSCCGIDKCIHIIAILS